MPSSFPEALRDGAGADAPSRALGPYETAYDVRRGYDAALPELHPVRRADPEAVWMGRRRER
ncbi:MAG: hypothetical protein ABW277_05105 [Longimicrobiaceae bacterium]